MPRLAVLILTTLLLALLPVAGQPAPKGVTESAYFPLKVGTQWSYRINDRKVTTRVVKHEEIDKVWCARLETKDGATVSSEYIGIQKEGVYRFRGDGMDVRPPLCLCKLPPQPGTVWEVNSSFSGYIFHGNCTLSAEDITVSKKRYKAVKVVFADLRKSGDKISMTTWYAPAVGMVKQMYKTGEVDLLIELEQFEAGK